MEFTNETCTVYDRGRHHPEAPPIEHDSVATSNFLADLSTLHVHHTDAEYLALLALEHRDVIKSHSLAYLSSLANDELEENEHDSFEHTRRVLKLHAESVAMRFSDVGLKDGKTTYKGNQLCTAMLGDDIDKAVRWHIFTNNLSFDHYGEL